MTITLAQLDWMTQDGVEIPVSTQFGDRYFSRENGLAETRHVFLQGNHLAQRLHCLRPYQYFCVGETGFGIGLNVLALWQLWQTCKPDNHSRLHVVTVEKFPLSKQDLQRALKAWPQLAELSKQLLQQYPPALAGCHRLIFANERFSIDLWLGDAAECLAKIQTQHAIDAWFLDSFAPKYNSGLWQENILTEVLRLSGQGTTFASCSATGLLKHGLKAHGIEISLSTGLSNKREMLSAIWPRQPSLPCVIAQPKQPRIAIVGAGIAGLSLAHSLSNRGIEVTLIDKLAPLAGASGNPRALLAPKLVEAAKIADNLMNIGLLLGYRYWQQYPEVLEHSQALLLLDNEQDAQLDLAHYPSDVLLKIDQQQASSIGATVLSQQCIHFKQAAFINPKALAAHVLSSPLIQFMQADIQTLEKNDQDEWQLLNDKQKEILKADHVIVCNALNSRRLCPTIPILKAIRGQVSWCLLDQEKNINCPISYGGYVAPIQLAGHTASENHANLHGNLHGNLQSHVIFGASFIQHNENTEVTEEDHQHNFNLLNTVMPELAQQLPPIAQWQGRASIRAQGNDYLPFVGAVVDRPNVWTISGLGSKGFSFAPICAEYLAALLLDEVSPISAQLAKTLSPSRFVKKTRIRKPYYQKPVVE